MPPRTSAVVAVVGCAVLAGVAAGSAIANGPAGTTAGAATADRAVPKPTLVRRPIPLNAAHRRQTRAYAKRHYGTETSVIARPRVIVEHWTASTTASSAYSTFATNAPDVELRERPGVCSQFLVDRDGTILQLTPIRFLCRHTVGLNDRAIGIEHVGTSDRDVLSRRRQMAASYRLTRWLRCRFDIDAADVIGHSESVGSPYHHERVARLRTQTHGDWRASSMRRYRAVVRGRGC